MKGRLRDSHGRAFNAAVGLLGAVVLVGGLVSYSPPIVAGAVLLAGAAAYWGLKNEMPEWKDLALVVLAALLTAAGLVLYDQWRGDHRYDFVIVPEDRFTFESAFPGPDHVSPSSKLFEYGEHVEIVCFREGDDGKPWAELDSGYFMPVSELVPAPGTNEPPDC